MRIRTNTKKIFFYFFSLLACLSFFFFSASATYDILRFLRPNLDFSNVETAKSSLPKAFVITSGSMEPSIQTASLVLSVPAKEYKVEDVVSFYRSDNDIVTHRIGWKGISRETGLLEYKTYGDANEGFDSGMLTHDKIIGKVVLTVPKVGYVVDFAKTPKGFILLVIVPATIIVYEELRAIKIEIQKKVGLVFSKYRKKTSQSVHDKRGISKVSILLPIVGSAAVLVGFTGSYFVDREIVLNNFLEIRSDEPINDEVPDDIVVFSTTESDVAVPTPTESLQNNEI